MILNAWTATTAVGVCAGVLAADLLRPVAAPAVRKAWPAIKRLGSALVRRFRARFAR